jgi:predicted HicB family RNase H-like nuclease
MLNNLILGGNVSDKMINMMVNIPEESKRKAKVEAAKQGISLKEFVVVALDWYIKKEDKK